MINTITTEAGPETVIAEGPSGLEAILEAYSAYLPQDENQAQQPEELTAATETNTSYSPNLFEQPEFSLAFTNVITEKLSEAYEEHSKGALLQLIQDIVQSKSSLANYLDTAFNIQGNGSGGLRTAHNVLLGYLTSIGAEYSIEFDKKTLEAKGENVKNELGFRQAKLIHMTRKMTEKFHIKAPVNSLYTVMGSLITYLGIYAPYWDSYMAYVQKTFLYTETGNRSNHQPYYNDDKFMTYREFAELAEEERTRSTRLTPKERHRIRL